MGTKQIAEIAERLDRLELLLNKVLERQDLFSYYLGVCEMQQLLGGCSKSFLYSLIDDGTIPRPKKLRGKAIWLRNEVIPILDKVLSTK